MQLTDLSRLTDLDKPIDDLIASNLTPADLAWLANTLAGAAAQLKRRKEVFDALMERLYGNTAQNAYYIARKDTGTVHFPASNTLNLTVERDKTVVWDNSILRNVLDAMTPEDARHYAKVKFDIDERKYTAAPPAIKTALDRARTVKPGKMKFTFKEVELV